MSLLQDYYKECEKYKENEKVIVLMQIGGFYEAYQRPDGLGSAEIVSKALHMHLTKKKNKDVWSDTNPKMAGFPLLSLQKHLTRLNDLNYEVVLFQQQEDNPKNRFLRGTFTKNIRMESDSLDHDVNFFPRIYSCVLEKYTVQRGKCREVEFRQHYSWVEVNSGKVYFVESVDSSYLRMLEQFLLQNEPKEMLFFLDGFEQEEKKFVSEILKTGGYGHICISDWEMGDYDKMEEKLEICFHQPPELRFYPYMIQNVYHLCQYLERHDKNQATNLIVPKDCWVQLDDKPHVHFNRDLYKELFLFSVEEERQYNVDKVQSVFDILSSGMNAMGKRFLQRILQRPLTSVDEIALRYEKIDQMTHDKKIYRDLPDMNWYYLRWRRFTLPQRNLCSMLFTYKRLSTIYSNLIPIIETIETYWNLEKMDNEEDFLKNTSNEYMDWNQQLEELTEKFKKEETNELTFYLTDSIVDSYFQITNARWKKWQKKEQDRFSILSCQTSSRKIMVKDYEKYLFKMLSLQTKIKKYQKERFEQDSTSIFETYGKHLEEFHEQISEDSALSVLKHFFKKEGYSCPIVEEKDDFFLHVTNIRHLIIEHLYPDEVFVPFSVEMNVEKMGKLIYGMNSSGKSTFMKSVALGLWMAQCGLWVCAEKFHYTPIHNFYSKFNHGDNLFKKHSLFISEISELKYIMDRIHKKTILFLDELLSGTEMFSSSSLITALLENFVNKRIFFFFTTHVHWISDYVEKNLHDNIDIFHFELKDVNVLKDEMLLSMNKNDFYNRSLQEGSGKSMYGIEVAEKFGICSNVIEKAKQIRCNVRFDYVEEYQRPSKYNSKLNVKECFKCGSREQLHTHHVFPQKNFNDSVAKDGFRKNGLYNLLVLCHACHERVHH
jgi:DNA mismatch repair protein MutS